jgi:hypothetical protein
VPFDDSGRLVWIANGLWRSCRGRPFKPDSVVDLREQSRRWPASQGFSPFSGVPETRLTGTGEAERVTGVMQRLAASCGNRP